MNAKDWINELQSNPDWTTTEIDWEAVDEIERKLKALEIIKKKGLDTFVFNNLDDYDDYLEYCECSEAFKSLFEYTKEEFDLLKEALR